MSAVHPLPNPQPHEDEGRATRTPLRPVRSRPPRLARLPFVIVLILVFAFGMGGLLFLNTTLQSQSFQAGALDTQAAKLSYDEASLQRQLDELNTPNALAQRATTLGMRPNPEPAFLVLPSGKIIGKAEKVTGLEAPNQIVKSKAQLAAEADARKAAKEEKARADAKRAAEKAAAKKAAEKKAAEKKAAAKKAAAKKAAEQKAAADKPANEPANGSTAQSQRGAR